MVHDRPVLGHDAAKTFNVHRHMAPRPTPAFFPGTAEQWQSSATGVLFVEMLYAMFYFHTCTAPSANRPPHSTMPGLAGSQLLHRLHCCGRRQRH